MVLATRNGICREALQSRMGRVSNEYESHRQPAAVAGRRAIQVHAMQLRIEPEERAACSPLPPLRRAGIRGVERPAASVSVGEKSLALQEFFRPGGTLGITDSLIRMSVGIEATEDLIEDFEQALEE